MEVVSSDSPQTLDYVRHDPHERPRINVPAVMSIATALMGLIFMFTVFAGIWETLVPGIEDVAGWMVLGMSICSVVCGGIGALRAPRESAWYATSLIGYAGGMFVGTLSPMLFMI